MTSRRSRSERFRTFGVNVGRIFPRFGVAEPPFGWPGPPAQRCPERPTLASDDLECSPSRVTSHDSHPAPLAASHGWKKPTPGEAAILMVIVAVVASPCVAYTYLAPKVGFPLAPGVVMDVLALLTAAVVVYAKFGPDDASDSLSPPD